MATTALRPDAQARADCRTSAKCDHSSRRYLRPALSAAELEDALRKFVAISPVAGFVVGFVAVDGTAEGLEVAAKAAGERRSACDDVGKIVVKAVAARMVDGVFAGAAAGCALQRGELGDQPVVARQRHAAAVEQWQEVDVNLALALLADLVADAALLELLARKFSAVSVSPNRQAAIVGFQQC